MALDSITETIAHFVGTFEISIEQARLRDQYEEFSALRRKAEIDGLDDPASINIKADLDIPAGEYKALPFNFLPSQPELPLPSAPVGPVHEAIIILNGESAESMRFVPDGPSSPSSAPELIILRPESVPLGSAMTFTVQKVVMRDNDTVGEGDFRDTEVLIAQGEEMLDMALSLHAVASPSFSLADYKSTEMVEALAEQMLDPMNAEVDGVTVHQFHGDDAMGVIVNGQYVAEAPVWKEILPEFHKPDEANEDEAEAMLPDEWDQSKDPEFDDGHLVVTGGNLAINGVSAAVGWVDAPYIAVGGQAISLTAISQVALVSDWDVGVPGASSGTDVIQSSKIEVEGREAPWLDDAAGTTGQPEYIVVDWVHGDLVVANFIKQVIDATDIDNIQTEISAASTLYAMGDNEMFNVTDIVQLGSYYDLIMIDGNMISVDMLYQTIALMDDDIISGGMPGAMAGDDENLLMNEASVKTIGEDIHQDLQQNLSDAMALEEMDMDALEDALLNDPMFAGMEQLRVLKIDGDLLQVNIIEQVTMMLDQDQVDLSGPNAAEAEVVAGSNALLNAANLTKMGVDSTVMAADGSYSDLLLHQASLIDMPDNEEITEMTNEAIAAIIDDMSIPQPDAAQALTTPSTETTTADDGLQTMLA
ncbi:type I secretion protein [uncultured Ruegeria sp.]|uniref:type I secretion protein n=1 Tax=uncultured Ruegeria sp. TaxID=259304 RepID=UPI00262D4188|nr:type I secretion protein [uncultured Ruegeria sp.]